MKSSKKFAAALITINIGLLAALGLLILSTQEKVPSKQTPEQLKSLPYLNWIQVSKDNLIKKGVTVHDKDLCFKGINLFNYDGFQEAYLMDMSGITLHTWFYQNHPWHHVEMYENGDLLGVVNNVMLVKLDWDSHLIWKSEMRYHHDVAISDNGDIYALIREVETIPHKSENIPIINDCLVVLSSDGLIKKKISIYDLFGPEIPGKAKQKIYDYVQEQKEKKENVPIDPFLNFDVFDVFHTNTVELITRDIKGLANRGDVLICIRNVNTIAIIDVEKEQIVWRLQRVDVDWPHQPTLNNGNILIFDNGSHRNYSRVININPLTGKKVWEYEADPKGSFFSVTRGGSQKLPNGNILITESNKARVFEITPEGKIVWEYFGTEIRERTKEKRPIYRMTRLKESAIPLVASRLKDSLL
ncbi:MAG: arylsulfotransferase family protein [Candidatus Aminicenantes bacterium]